MKRKLSIIVPIYNVEAYLEECVNSLIGQTYQNLEIILVNDGSTDRCGEICDQFSRKYSNIKVVHQSNKGLPHARNAGLDIATGDYIGFIDSDDTIHRDMYQTLISAAEQTSADMAVCNCSIFNKNGVKAISQRFGAKTMAYADGEGLQWYDYAMDSACTKVYKHEIIKNFELRFEDKSIVAQEDFWFLIRYCSHISRIVSVPDAFYQYRERGSSISRSSIDKDITQRCITFIELTEQYLKTVGRYSSEFLEHMTLNLMYASINQFSRPSLKEIRRTVEKFCVTPYFDKAIHRKTNFSITIKGVYDTFKSGLLKIKWYGMFSVFESFRVKRLHNHKNILSRFE